MNTDENVPQGECDLDPFEEAALLAVFTIKDPLIEVSSLDVLDECPTHGEVPSTQDAINEEIEQLESGDMDEIASERWVFLMNLLYLESDGGYPLSDLEGITGSQSSFLLGLIHIRKFRQDIIAMCLSKMELDTIDRSQSDKPLGSPLSMLKELSPEDRREAHLISQAVEAIKQGLTKLIPTIRNDVVRRITIDINNRVIQDFEIDIV